MRKEAPQVSAMLVARHGYLVFERYYGGYTAASYFSVASITKTVLSALIGIAFRDGLLKSVDQPIAEFFPTHETYGLTIRQLLTLTAGWPYREFEHQPGTVEAILVDRPVTPPGQRFLYGESAPHLLSAILTRLTGESLAVHAQREMFGPLGIWRNVGSWQEAPHTVNDHGEWPEDGLPWKCHPDGLSGGGFGLHLTVRDMARFGLLYASGGWWEELRLVPTEYFADSTRPQSRGGSPMWMPYGWLWWIPSWHRGHPMLAAGFGGQEIYVNAEIDLVITIACTFRREAPHNGRVLERYLLPAVEDW